MIIKYENNRPDKSTFIVYCCILLVSLYNDYVRSFKGGGCLFPFNLHLIIRTYVRELKIVLSIFGLKVSIFCNSKIHG